MCSLIVDLHCPLWLETLVCRILDLLKIAESCTEGYKTKWEKEKLLVTCNFSFSHSVFKRLVLQTCKNKGLFGKPLKPLPANVDFEVPEEEAFLDIVGKKDIKVNSLFPQCFLHYERQILCLDFFSVLCKGFQFRQG